MKKLVSLFLAVLIVVFSFIPVSAFASGGEAEWQDIYLPQTVLDEILEVKEVNARATGLILTYALGIKKDGNNLIIAGSTTCTSTVVKSGFKEVVIQRRANSTQDWSDYVTYHDLYNDMPSYLLSKSIAVGTGYQYRVTAIHYAKKNILITQKLDNVSNIVTF